MGKARILIALVMVASAAIAAPKKKKAPPPVTQLAPVEAPKSIQTASIDLGAEFPQMKGYVFTQGVNVIQPGTGRALHSHAGKPEIVRILTGTLTDARNGGPAIRYGPGSTLVNAGGVQHTWANLGTEPVVFISTGIDPAPDPGADAKAPSPVAPPAPSSAKP